MQTARLLAHVRGALQGSRAKRASAQEPAESSLSKRVARHLFRAHAWVGRCRRFDSECAVGGVCFAPAHAEDLTGMLQNVHVVAHGGGWWRWWWLLLVVVGWS
jgi:hypothetical protein